MCEKPLEEHMAPMVLSKILSKCELLLIHGHCLPAPGQSLLCLSELPNQFNLKILRVSHPVPAIEGRADVSKLESLFLGW